MARLLKSSGGSSLTILFSPRNLVFVSLAAVVGIALIALAGFVSFGHGTPAGTGYIISQKNRKFDPTTLTVHAGDTVTIVNDDGGLHHHAYVSSPEFSFDSGDQLPGSRTSVVFTLPGRFNVLCGIHPKMRLTVTVH